MSKYLLLMMGLCLGCTHAPVRLVPGDCETNALIGISDARNSYVIEKEYWSFMTARKILLSDILKEESRQCDEVIRMDWKLVQKTSDVFLSLLPMASKGRIFLYYKLK